MATGYTETITVSSAPDQPPPVPKYGEKWAKRLIQFEVSLPKATGANQYVNILAPTELDTAILDSLTIWGVGTQSLYASLNSGTTTDLNQGFVDADDFSSLAQLPGVCFRIPVGHAKGLSNGAVLGQILRLGDVDCKAVIHADVWIRY